MCSLTIECVLLLTIECVLLLTIECVFLLTIECVLLQRVQQIENDGFVDVYQQFTLPLTLLYY